MKNTVKILAAVLTLAAGSSSFVAVANAAMMNPHVTMKQCKKHHSEHYCLMSVHQHTSNDGNTKPAQ